MVDDTGQTRPLDLLAGEGGGISLLRDAVEDGAERYIVALALAALDLLERVARTAYLPAVTYGRQRMAAVEVYAAQSVSLGQRKGAVQHDTVAQARRYGAQEFFYALVRSVGLAQVERLQSAVHHRYDHVGLAFEEVGPREEYHSHGSSEMNVCIVLISVDQRRPASVAP